MLDAAWETRVPITPLSEAVGLSDVSEAYAIQAAWTELRRSRGERVLGRKIGLTSRAMQEAAGVFEPDFGALWSSRFVHAALGVATMPHDAFIQPRLEGEIAYLLGSPLRGPDVSVADVQAATDAVAASFEVVDSRIIRREFKLVDTVSDNASYGAFTLGPWDASLAGADLRALGMLISQNGELVVEGVGAASLGNPATAVAWLANKLDEFGVGLDRGDIILSGSLGRAVPIAKGDTFVLELHGQPPLTMSFP
ncbi:MAG TPA: fumarylacetoacetate hydrolase family protein [Thermomicrobiales bacterium]|nr:fumarylacetoacetate hydrolase family protein [Thermomicrobiales bacterium]